MELFKLTRKSQYKLVDIVGRLDKGQLADGGGLVDEYAGALDTKG